MKVFIWFMVLTGMPAIMGSLSGQSTRSSTSTPAAEEETDLELFEFYDRYKRSPLNIGSNSRRTRIQPKNKSKSKSKSSSSNSAGGSSYTYSDSSTANSINTSSGSVWKGNPDEYTIGGVLSGKSGVEHYFTRVLSDVEQRYLRGKVSLNEATQTMDTNPIKTAITVCSELIRKQVYAIIVSKPSQGDLSPASVSYTAGFYHIPVIGISSRDSAFSDKNIHVSFLRTVPPYSHQANVWVEMLKQFKYRQLVFIHSSDTDGRALLGRFQTQTQDLEADDQEVKVEKVEEFEPGKTSYFNMLEKIKECQARVYFLYASTVDADQIFKDAEELNMTGSGYVWIVTEQALSSQNVPSGTLGLELVGAANEEDHINDSLNILAMALNELDAEKNVTAAPSNCNTSGALWETGKQLFEYIQKQTHDGTTGRVGFDEMGDRIYAEYQIVNMQRKRKVTVGYYNYSNDESKMSLSLEQDNIIWPGGLRKKPTGLMIPTHLNVLTISEQPFVYNRTLAPGEICDRDGEILCPQYNTEASNPIVSSAPKHCCYGYCIDLLQKLSQTCNFTFSLHLSNNSYGSLEKNKTTDKSEWNGLIGQLVQEQADLIVAPLTINPERAQVMEFSKPFKYQGITILQKRQPRASQLVSFLQPFKSTLWVLVLVSVKVVALCLYLLDRFSPFGRFEANEENNAKENSTNDIMEDEEMSPNSPEKRNNVQVQQQYDPDHQKEESLNLTSAIWFAWGVLLNSGIGEGTPRSFSARVLGMVWAGFAMIIVASYTANLAAFLVLDKPQTSLTGINDPRLRNPMENFTYATVKASAVDMYFRRQVELSNMYRTMEGKHYETPDEAIKAVKDGQLKAFIWDSSRLEYEAARDCDLITAGDLFGRSGYGVGLQKGSPWADKITLAILDFHESGQMEELDNKWIYQEEVKCDSNDDNSPATLGLSNMRGVFILVGVGIIGGIFLICVEIIFKKHQKRLKLKDSMAKTAVRKWRGNVEKHKTIKDNNRKLKSNGYRSSVASAATLVHTPESLTLSVGSLPQRPIYPSDSSNQWRSPTSIAENTVTSEHLPPPPVYREAMKMSKVDAHADFENDISTASADKTENDLRKASIPDLPIEDDYDIPPPVPPHRTSVTLERPKSANANSCEENAQINTNSGLRYYDKVEMNLVRGGSREHLIDHHHHHHLYSNRLHRSVGSGLEQQIKSPSSSDSSRKKNTKVLVISAGPQAEQAPLIKPITPSRMQKTRGKHSQQNYRVSETQRSANGKSNLKKTSTALDHDILSSPEYPSTSSDIRMIPQPPPPPKMYWVQNPNTTVVQRVRYPQQNQERPARPGQVVSGGGSGPPPPPLVATPLSHHPGATVQAALPQQTLTRDQLYNRRSRGMHYDPTDDSDV